MKLAVFIVAIAAVGLSMGLAPSSSPGGPLALDTLYVTPDADSVVEGDVFTLGIGISAGISGLMGYDVAVVFDSSLIEILSVEEGPLPQTSSDETFFWWFNPGVKTDSIHVNGAVLGQTVDGPGVLFTVTFEALKYGRTDVRIVYSELRNGVNQSIEHHVRDGIVWIDEPISVRRTTWGALKKRYQ